MKTTKAVLLLLLLHVNVFAQQIYRAQGDDILEALSKALCSSKVKNIGYAIQISRFYGGDDCFTCSVHIHRKTDFYLIQLYRYKEQNSVRYSGSDIMLDESGASFHFRSHIGEILRKSGVKIAEKEIQADKIVLSVELP